MAIDNKVVSHCKKIVDQGQKIALVRDLAIALTGDADLIADIQRHYEIKVKQLARAKSEGGL